MANLDNVISISETTGIQCALDFSLEKEPSVSTLLLSTFHDPEARLLPLVERLSDPIDPLAVAWRKVAASYAGHLAVVSPPTEPRSARALEAAGWRIVIRQETGPDRGLWETVRLGLDQGTDLIHFCDLDRFVHWLERFPEELRALPEVWDRYDLTMLVRTSRAFATHPTCQTVTEGIGNRVLSHRIGIPDSDALSGSYLWKRRAAEAILANPGPRDLRFYILGVLAPYRAGCSIGRHIVEGLEWETPDQYPDEIARLGYDAWLARFQSAEQWQHRAEMAKLWVEEVL